MNRKNLFKVSTMALLASFASCTTDDLVEQECNGITMTGSDFEYDEASRTSFEVTNKGVSFTWAANDTVGIFPNKGRQVDFPMVNGAGTKSASFSGGGWALKPSSSYTAYYPLQGKFYLDKKHIPVSYVEQVQNGNASTEHLGKYDFMAASATTPASGNVKFAFQHLGSMIELNICVPQAGEVTEVKLTPRTMNDEFTATGEIDLTAENPSVKTLSKMKAVTLGINNLTTTKPYEDIKVYFMQAPCQLNNVVADLEVVCNKETHKGTIVLGNFEAGKAYSRTAAMEERKPLANSYIVNTPGTLSDLVNPEDKKFIAEMKVTGSLNGTDIRFIREMLGIDVNGNKLKGSMLHKLDLYDARIVKGGSSYYRSDYFTTDDEIGNRMFAYVDSLREIVLPKDTKVIGERALQFCKKLHSISMPNSVTRIDYAAFDGCKSLQHIKLSSELASIGDYAFSTSGIRSIVIPNKVKSIGNSAFFESTLEQVTLPDGLLKLGEKCFLGTNLVVASVPYTVKRIPSSCFSSCFSLRKVNLFEGLEQIGYGAFFNIEKLKADIVVPTSVTFIDSDAFVFVPARLVLKDTRTIIPRGFCPHSGARTIVMPASITTIEANSLPSSLEMYCYGIVPPKVDPDNYVPAKLHVKPEALDAYMADEFWGKCKNWSGDFK